MRRQPACAHEFVPLGLRWWLGRCAVYSNTDSDSDSDPDTYADSDPDTDTDTYAYAYAHAYAHPDTYSIYDLERRSSARFDSSERCLTRSYVYYQRLSSDERIAI
jgi:hypothetical protein